MKIETKEVNDYRARVYVNDIPVGYIRIDIQSDELFFRCSRAPWKQGTRKVATGSRLRDVPQEGVALLLEYASKAYSKYYAPAYRPLTIRDASRARASEAHPIFTQGNT